jgi:hypothetical protein
MNNNTRRIFIDILVNGNIYKKKDCLEIPVCSPYSQEDFIQNRLLSVHNIENIPLRLLSYEIVSEVSEKQKEVLGMIFDDILCAVNEGQSRFGYHDINLNNGVITISHKDFGEATIHAKDIIIKE